MAAESEGARDALWASVQVAPAGHGRRAGARHDGGAGAAPVPGSSAATSVSLLIVLPIALPGIVTGIALQQRLHRPSSGSSSGLLHHRGHRPRDVLHRHRLQQRAGPGLPAGRQPRGGVDGPRRRPVHDLPAGDVPAAALGAAGRWHCCRSACRSTRSSSRTFTAGAGSPDAADLDLQEPLPAQPGPGRQRGRGGPGGARRSSRSTWPSGCRAPRRRTSSVPTERRPPPAPPQEIVVGGPLHERNRRS